MMASRQRYYVGEDTRNPGWWAVIYDVMGLPKLYATVTDQENALFVASLLNQAEGSEISAAHDALLPLVEWLNAASPELLEQLETMAEFHLEYEEPKTRTRTALAGFLGAIVEMGEASGDDEPES